MDQEKRVAVRRSPEEWRAIMACFEPRPTLISVI